MGKIEAHAAAELWLWEAEQMETGPFWRSFSLDFFAAMRRRFEAGDPRPPEAPPLAVVGHAFADDGFGRCAALWNGPAGSSPMSLQCGRPRSAHREAT